MYRISAGGADGERDEEEESEPGARVLTAPTLRLEVSSWKVGRVYGLRFLIDRGPGPMGAFKTETSW